MKWIQLALIAVVVGSLVPAVAAQPVRPNIVFLLADDLGYGDVGCFGQRKIRTPNLDNLAKQGMKLTQHYAGSNVCAPSRCALMTGLHPGHGYIRENHQAQGFPEGQEPVPAGYLRFPLELKKLGYTLGGFGKWGLGPMGSTGDPLTQGFDRWYGYNCQAVAHNYFPTHLWDNDKQVELNNPKFPAHQKLPTSADESDPRSYASFTGADYAPDLISSKAREFLAANKDKPFVLYYPTTVPHLALQAPDDSLQEYVGKFEDVPYVGNRGYLPHRQPRAAYAAMVTRMDKEIGELLGMLRDLGLDEKTIVVFTSDNGPLYDQLGGTDTGFFDSAAGLRGRKGSFYEAGYRVPCIVRWTGRIRPGTTSDRITGFEDWFPTLFELIGATDHVAKGIDGISFAPTLLGENQEPRPFLYRESPGYTGQQSVRVGDWKAIRRNLNPGPKAANQKPGEIELYDLAADPRETTNVASANEEVVARLKRIMEEQHTASTLFPLKNIDGE
jgi:arylsulfatase A